MRCRRSLALTSSLILTAVILNSSLQARQATVTESLQTFRTYPFGDPDPVAQISTLYPYFRFDGYSITPVKREWKIVTLENPYIRVLIAPEIGGKILGAVEKSTGKAFIYTNRVVKFRQIAMRGPWTSGGIEFNFGDIGHAPSTATPVEYTTRTNDDGSVSCIVGTIDLASRTEWHVDIRLPKDKAYFETESFWYNPTDLNTSLYHWMNAAADASPDLRFIFPGTAFIDHSGVASPWPIDSTGRDLSRYSNNAFGSNKSYHVVGAYTDTYAAYWAKDDFGVVHWSPYTDKPGKKIWIWAQSREGEIWKDLLTDPDLGNKQYVEIQSGLLFNQAAGASSRTPFKHEFFAPVSEENFVEAWFPFKNIGGMVEANLSGSLNVQRSGKMLKIGFCPLGRTEEPLTVSRGGKVIYRRYIDLQPLEAFVDSLATPEGGDIQVSVGDLLSYSTRDAGARKLHRPLVAGNEFDWNSLPGLYTEGEELAKQRNYSGALEIYLECLSRDPAYSPALVGAAEMYYRRLEYESALRYARNALSNDAYDPDANFIYGVINRKLGNLYDALDGFGVAARTIKYRSAANAEMAEISFLQSKWPAAEAYALRALDYDRLNVRASRLLCVLYRTQGSSGSANSAITHLLAIDPLSNLARFEEYLVDTTQEKLANFKRMIRDELPQERYLELASYYLGLKLYGDAIRLLQQAPTHPIVSYWLAYLSQLENRHRQVEGYLKEAEELSPALVFPFRPETIEILAWAERKSTDWKTKYYLALAYWSKDRFDEAKRLFLACGNAPDYAPFYITRANLLRTEKGGDALRDYDRALELGRDEWRAYHALVEYRIRQTEYSDALPIARRAVERSPSSYVALFDLARVLVLDRQPQASLSILDTLIILPSEGARFSHDVYRQACILSAAGEMKDGKYHEAVRYLQKAREWPERLGVGRPYDVDNRFEDYLEGVCHSRIGEGAQAKRLFEHAASYTRTHPGDWGTGRLFGALAERALGREDVAAKLVQEWTRERPSDATRWLLAVLSRNPQEAGEIERELRGKTNESLLGRSSMDQEFALAVEVYALQGF